MKKFSFRLAAAMMAMLMVGATMLIACDKDDDKDDDGGSNNKAKFTDPSKIDLNNYDDKVERCWEYTTTVGSYSEVNYEWGTEKQIVAGIKWAMEEVGGKGVTCTYKQADPTTEEACEKLEDENQQALDANRACYKVSGKRGGVIEEGYVWATQEELNAMKQMAAQEGVTNISSQKTNIPDEDACDDADEEING